MTTADTVAEASRFLAEAFVRQPSPDDIAALFLNPSVAALVVDMACSWVRESLTDLEREHIGEALAWSVIANLEGP